MRYETRSRGDRADADVITDAGLPAPTCHTYPPACSKERMKRCLKKHGSRCTLGCEERINTVTRKPDRLFEPGRS